LSIDEERIDWSMFDHQKGKVFDGQFSLELILQVKQQEVT
jgi:hypothetical protein